MNNKSNGVLRRYDEEFRRSLVKLALDSEFSLGRTARDLGLKEHTLYD